jgi:hypothetical protein
MAKMDEEALLRHLQSNEDDASEYVDQVGFQRLSLIHI